MARPAGDQIGLVDAVRAAESALAQARTLFDALDSAAGDINRAVASLPAAITDLRAGIAHAGSLLQKPDTPQAAELTAALKKANDAVAGRRSRRLDGSTGHLHDADQGRRRTRPVAGQRRTSSAKPWNG